MTHATRRASPSLKEHVASDAATRSGNEQDGYALEVVGEAWREVESS
jgi:hypothetical protein